MKTLFSSLKQRIIFLFGTLFIVGFLGTMLVEQYGLPFLGIKGRSQTLREQKFNTLSLIADLKKERLTRWLMERLSDSRLILESDLLKPHLGNVLALSAQDELRETSPEEFSARAGKIDEFAQLHQRLAQISDIYGIYEKIMIIDAESGRTVSSSDREDIGVRFTAQGFFRSVADSGQPYLNIERDPFTGLVEFFCSTPVFGEGGKVRAVMAMHVYMEDIISPLLSKGGGLGLSGETLLVNMEGKLLTPLRHRMPDGSVSLPLQTEIKAEPARLSITSEEEGTVEANDYRGVPVLAAYRQVIVNGKQIWGMVVKEDRREIFAELVKLDRFSLLFDLFMIAVVLFAGALISRDLTRPVQELKDAARRLEQGDLSARAEVGTNDEIEQLAHALNSMASAISQREEQLREEIETRKKTMEELEKSRARLQEAQRITHLGHWDWNIVENTLEWSDEVYRIFGLIPRQFKGTYEAFLERVHPADRQAVIDAVNGSLAREFPYSIDHRVVRPDGGERIVHERAAIHWDEEGKPLRMLGTVQDITEQKKTEAAVRKLNDELEQRVQDRTRQLKETNEELESFAYSVSHDLRAPLRAIVGFSQALEEDYGEQLDGEAKRFLDRIKSATFNMSQLIEDMLKLSRIMRQSIHRSEVNLTAEAKYIIQKLQESDPKRKVEAVIEPGLTAIGDKRLLDIALENLISNAWKFTSKASHAVIEVGRTETGYGPAFFVKDNGAGFNPDYRSELFKPFQRLHTPREFPGTGVGLATVHRIIKRHNGRVWAEGKPGEGAVFYFTIE